MHLSKLYLCITEYTNKKFQAETATKYYNLQ